MNVEPTEIAPRRHVRRRRLSAAERDSDGVELVFRVLHGGLKRIDELRRQRDDLRVVIGANREKVGVVDGNGVIPGARIFANEDQLVIGIRPIEDAGIGLIQIGHPVALAL